MSGDVHSHWCHLTPHHVAWSKHYHRQLLIKRIFEMSYTITLTSPATVASSSTSPPTTSTQSHQTKRKESPPAHEVQSNSNSSGHGNDISTVTEEYLPHARMRMVREYLCGIPRVWRLTDSYRAPPRNLQEGLPNSSIASSEGDINSEQPSTRANAIDVTVLEFGDIPVKRQLFTLEDLDNHLNANPRPPNARAYFVPTSWLPVYGLLGSSLNIDHDFFALYSTKQPVPLEFSLPSFEKSNNHWRFRYMSMISGEKQIVERCVALWIADSQNDNWIGETFTACLRIGS